MKNIFLRGLQALALAALCWGCKEKIDTSARYVFTVDQAMSYLEKHEAYSQYVELLGQVPISMRSKSTVAQLLAARGHYTVFAPTNEAVEAYLQQLCEEEPDLLSAPSWDAFRSEQKRDSIRRVIVCNSIIDSAAT